MVKATTTDLSDQELIEKYVSSMEWRQLQPTTIYVRRTYLTKFSKEIGGFREANAETVMAWLNRPSLQSQSRNIWLTTLHCAYEFWAKQGYTKRVRGKNGAMVDFDPTADIEKPRSKKGHPHPITEADLEEVLKWATAEMRCWLLLGALAGARCCEIAAVARADVRDLELEPMLSIPRGKGNKEREVPLHQDVLDAMNALGMPASGRLWDLTAQQMSKAINAHLHALGAKTTAGTPATAHALRHYYGTAMYRLSTDLQFVADLLGHANTAVTSVYAAADHRKASALVGMLKIGGATRTEEAEAA